MDRITLPSLKTPDLGTKTAFDRLKKKINELVDAAGTFLLLTDTPASYEGKARNAPRVNAEKTALEFVPLEDERIRFHHASDDAPLNTQGSDGDVWLEY